MNLYLWLVSLGFFFFFKQKTAYEMRISDWSSDVCSSDLEAHGNAAFFRLAARGLGLDALDAGDRALQDLRHLGFDDLRAGAGIVRAHRDDGLVDVGVFANGELQVGDQADQDDDKAHHGREDRPADEEFEGTQGSGSRVRLHDFRKSTRLKSSH